MSGCVGLDACGTFEHVDIFHVLSLGWQWGLREVSVGFPSFKGISRPDSLIIIIIIIPV